MGESGQAVIEFGIIGIAAMMLTVGLVDVGRAFYQYNAVASAASFGARWGAVVGGSCILPGTASSDWCTQQGTQGVLDFWQQNGNRPLQGNDVACPSFSSNPSAYYSVSSYLGSTATTIVAAIAHRFDTSSSSSSFAGLQVGGFNYSQVKVCIQTSDPATDQKPGDYVTVTVYYHFNPIGLLVAQGSFDLVATSQYEVE
jgi:hypothetical protein